MINNEQIKLVRFENIDADKWDACIAKSPNALVYAQSWYLDRICDQWDALIFGNYQYVMPLTFRKKIRVSYLFQPLFGQQLGVFPTPTKEILRLFINEAEKNYGFAEINLNSMNLPVTGVSGSFIPRKNYLLQLHLSYPEIVQNYSKHTKRKLKKASSNKLSLIKGVSVEDYIQFKKQNQKIKILEKNYMSLRNIISFALAKSMGQIYGVYSNQNELCAAVFFLRFKKRISYLNAATNNEGRELNAMFFLIDQFVLENANSEFMIDFEGSNIPGIARLYKGFGASPEIYHHLRWNKLPVWLKWFKK